MEKSHQHNSVYPQMNQGILQWRRLFRLEIGDDTSFALARQPGQVYHFTIETKEFGPKIMRYQRSLVIETRLQTVLRLIRSGRFSTPMLAKQLGVSIPTVSRDVNALRERGYEIHPERKSGSWHYVLGVRSSRIQASMQRRTNRSETLLAQYGTKRMRREARIA
jgi:biotin operon repressor